MENLLPLIVFALIAAFSAWLKKQRQGEDSGSWQGGPPPPVPPPATDWEEEMKRLLGVPTAPPAAPPPIPVPREPVEAAPRPVTSSEPSRPRPAVKVSVPSAAPSAWLAKAAKNYDRASSMDERVAERLKKVSGNLAKKRVVRRAQVPEGTSRRARELLRDPSGLRAAVVTSIVLGPPKG